MLDLKYVRENLDLVKENFKNRNYEFDMNNFISLDNKRKEILKEVESLKYLKNQTSDEIGKLKSKNIDASNHLSKMSEVSKKIKEYENSLEEVEKDFHEMLYIMPNLFDSSVPIGRTENENIEVKKWGEPKEFNFKVKDHTEIGSINNILDFERASKMSGARFVVYKGKGAALERALINFMLETHISKHNYTEIIPPLLVKEHSMYNAGQFPKFREDNFSSDDNLFLIPTSEVPLANLHSNEILEEEELPKLYTAYTPCFRREAGSYGKDTKGIIRLHQFNKVELVKIVKPEDSDKALNKLVEEAEHILQSLNLPYRVVLKCTGDTGFTASKTYDLEVWLPSQNKYREISSCSNVKDFQARRSSIKFKRKDSKKSEFIHMLNGSGLAIGRTFAAILENYQNEDGTYIIPEVLKKYII